MQIKEYEKLDLEEERLSRSRQIYDTYIMKELLSCSHVRALNVEVLLNVSLLKCSVCVCVCV